METLLFGKALLMGLSIAAPVGPIGLLCMQRTLRHGAQAGFVSGLGAACADALYGALGAIGAGSLMRAFLAQSSLIGLGGALLLGVLGVGILRGAGGTAELEDRPAPRLWRAWFSVLLLTLANPMTMLSFAAIYAALAEGRMSTGAGMATMVGGVFCGSALWWGGLAWTVARLRHRLGDRARLTIARFSGLTLVGIALWQWAVHWPR